MQFRRSLPRVAIAVAAAAVFLGAQSTTVSCPIAAVASIATSGGTLGAINFVCIDFAGVSGSLDYSTSPPTLRLVVPQVVDEEVPAGALDGVNTAFVLAHIPNPATSLQVYINGLRMHSGVDFTLAGNAITLTGYVPKAGQNLIADYRY